MDHEKNPADDTALDPIFRAGYKAGFEAGKASVVPLFGGAWGRPCAKCGAPVGAPTSRYMKPAVCFGDRVWHGHCFPADVSGTFTV